MEKSMSRKQQIARAAMEIISEEGVHNLVMVKIGQRVGVTDAALYKYFKSKNALIFYMIEELEKSMLSNFMKHIENIENPIERLRGLLHFQLKFIEQNKGIPRIIFSESLQQLNQDIKAKIKNLLANYREAVRDILKSAKNNGFITGEIDIDAAACIFIGMIQSSVIFWTLSDFSSSLGERQESLWQEYCKIIR